MASMYLSEVLTVPKLGLLLVIILCLGTVTLWLKGPVFYVSVLFELET